MTEKQIIANQKTYFLEGNTLSYKARYEALHTLYNTIKEHEEEVLHALESDLGKHRIEGYFSEVGQVYKEISYIKKNLKRYMKNKRSRSELSDFPSKSFVSPHPYGVVLVVSPWNYPFLLAIGPVIGAIAAGNTVIIKPSEFSIHTTKVIKKIMDVYDDRFISVVTGGVEETTNLLNEKLDYIFFTGSTNVGRIIMEKASKHLTPISLELGGKSPVIVDRYANIKIAAKRVAFGKLLNSGQTCIAPDYLFVHKDVKESFLMHYKQAVKELYGNTPITSKDYGKIINHKHFKRLQNLMKDGKTIFGGEVNEEKRVIAPTIIDDVSMDDNIMQEEIFGPILPVIEFEDIKTVTHYINTNSNPLALYLFTENKHTEKFVLDHCKFGGGCINDTIVQAGSHYLPFGGVGESGIGSYHGENTFKTFSHYRSVIKKSTKIDLPMRYAPYSRKTERLLRRLLK